jgi:hypothetical protein
MEQTLEFWHPPLPADDGTFPDWLLLREKALESWDHRISHELVYTKEVTDAALNPLVGISECDINRNGWIEIQVRLGGQRKSHYAAIVRSLGVALQGSGEVACEDNGSLRGMNDQMPMLVDVPKFIEEPKETHLVVLPVMIWLKRLHDTGSGIGDSECLFCNPLLSVDGILAPDWEADFAGRFEWAKQDQFPNKIIQRGTQARDEVSRDEREGAGRVAERYGYDVLSGLQIIVAQDSIRLRGNKLSNSIIERVKVCLRPTNLQIDIFKGWHGSNPNMVSVSARAS